MAAAAAAAVCCKTRRLSHRLWFLLAVRGVAGRGVAGRGGSAHLEVSGLRPRYFKYFKYFKYCGASGFTASQYHRCSALRYERCCGCRG